MHSLLYFAAGLILVIGFVHSVLGEKYIIARLLRRDDLPQLFGSADFTRRTLRCAWHLTTVAWLGLAAVLVSLARPSPDGAMLAAIVGVTFLLHFLVALIGTRGRHLSWIIFLGVAVCALIVAGG